MKKLPRTFFQRHTLDVAKDLIGKKLIYQNWEGIICESEAYRQDDDPACHAYKGPTKRNLTMFGEAGIAYVYLIYGMYHCLNIVTEQQGYGAAVLIRGLQLIKPYNIYIDGPGKLCRALSPS